MAGARPFGVFILALCLVACVCAHGQVSKADAEKIIGEAKNAAKKTLKDANEKFRNAERYLNDADANKRSAERATAEADKAAKGNQAAEAIAKKVKDASDEALKKYTEVSASAKDSVDKMNALLTKAKGLDAKATAIQLETTTTDDYAETKKSAVSVKTEVDALDKEITAASGLRPSYETLNKMSEFVKTAQLAKYHVDAIVAVTNFETLLKSADDDIKLTEQKRDEIATIEKEMKEIFDNSPKDLIHYISSLYSTVGGYLRSASYKVDEAKAAKASMLEQKKRADAALAKVKDETDVDEAKKEAESASWITKNAAEKLKDTKKALESATTSAINAGYQKNDAVKAINEKDKKPDVPQENDKTSPHDSSNTHQPVKDTTESPTVIGTQQPTTTNPDQPRSRGTEPTQPSSSDSAMTVSFPLLMALIACAALH